jgi:phytoene dehydrogenase-like protein
VSHGPPSTWTRREVLGSLLGAAAASACRRPLPPPELEGRLVGPSVEHGHRLRDLLRAGGLPAPSGPVRERPVLILGGGVAGLTAAWRLRRDRGPAFTLIELEPSLGGTARGDEAGGLRFPWGAHYLPAPTADQPELLELLAETGSLVGREDDGRPRFDEAQLCADPEERVFHKGWWQEGLFPMAGAAADELAELARFRHLVDGWVRWRDGDGRRAFCLPLDRCSQAAEVLALDRLTMAEWMDREGLRGPRLRWYVDYACRDDYGSDLDDTSAWAGLFYFAARVPAPGEESAEFLTWPQGNGFLVEHLARAVPPDSLALGLAVGRVAPAPDGRRVDVTTLDASGAVTLWRAERVVFALPSFLRAHLLSAYPAATAYAPRYGPWMVANVHLSGRPASRGYPQCWDNVIHGSRSLGYVVATHQAHIDRGPTVWTHYLPRSRRDVAKERAELLALSWREAADAVVAELDACHVDLRRHLVRVDVMRWGHAMVRAGPGELWSPARRAAATPIGPIHFAHTDLSGLPLFEEAFFHGSRAAREVRAALGA